MKTLKRSVAVLLSILMLISVFSATAMTAFASSTTVYFVNSYNWGEVYAYVWQSNDNGDNVVIGNTWAGQPANVVDAEKGIYSYDLGEGNAIVFNDNGNGSQTRDLYLSEGIGGKYYEIKTDKFYNTADEAIAAAGGNTSTSSNYYVVGEMAGISWDAGEAGTMTKNEDGSFTKTFENVVAGSYPIKINNGTWDECYPAGDNWIVNVEADHSTVIVTLSADKNMNVEIIAPDSQEPSSVTPVTGGYCIVGNINGVDVGDGDTGWQDVVNQIDVNQPLTMDITTDSYVYVKSADCTQWFMFNEYCQDLTGTLYNTSTGAKEKMYVPAGTITFSLAVNADGTLTLSYQEGKPGTTTPSSEPSESTAPTTPVAPANPAVYPVSVEAKADDTVTVKFALQVAEECVNGEGGLTYDSTALQLEKFELLNVTGAYQNTDLHNEVLFNFTDVQNPADFSTAKDFVVVTFKALKDAKSEVTLNLVELNATATMDVALVTDGNIVGDFALTATASNGTETPAPAPAISVKKKLKAGDTTTVKVENSGDEKVTFKSTKTKVATVDANGKITALAKGKTTIEVTIGDVTLKKIVKVKTNPVLKNGKKTVKNNHTITIKKGKTLTLNIEGKVATIKNTVKTSKKNVGKITSKAKQTKVTFKAKKKGTTTLTITINNVKTYKVKVKVN